MLGRFSLCVKGLYNLYMTMYKVRAGDTVVVWFRRDLRVADHPALTEAAERARVVVPLFVLDDQALVRVAPARAWYLRGALQELDRALRSRGSRLLLRTGDPVEIVPDVARAVGANVVLASDDVTPYSLRRDAAVASALQQDGRSLELRDGLLLADPDDIRTGDGRPYTVFTPFWRALGRATRRALLPAPSSIPTAMATIRGDTLPAPGVAPLPGLPTPGEPAAQQRVDRWVADGLARYRTDRDGLDGEGTSHLGADLHFGTLSPLQVEAACESAGPEAEAFTRQLAWRELYHHQLFHQACEPRRRLPLEDAFRSEPDDPDAVAAWREGRTGIPAVDAAMRQLRATGWLSNRARLVTASFLTRHLLMHPRIGERHFMDQLVDGDVANNRGGWEWTAGIGLDAQPWFRIFNPVRQGQRFDPQGSWVRRWVPELEAVPERFVHAPWEWDGSAPGYPAPIVDLKIGRERALAAFKAATGG
jgi:deoxyribodipyrimidine photo-lyase